jgi:hypothetical protein
MPASPAPAAPEPHWSRRPVTPLLRLCLLCGGASGIACVLAVLARGVAA